MQGQCKNGVCTSRFNTIADGYETGADCGGPTCQQRCPLGGAGALDSDCEFGLCDATARVCRDFTTTELCSNSAQDNQETDVDCGSPVSNPRSQSSLPSPELSLRARPWR